MYIYTEVIEKTSRLLQCEIFLNFIQRYFNGSAKVSCFIINVNRDNLKLKFSRHVTLDI